MIEANSVAGEIFLAKKLSELRVDSLEALPVSLRRQIRKEKLKIDLGAVFGESVQFDDQGQPVEHGLGSSSNMTLQAVMAFEKYNDCSLPSNAEHLKLIKQQYAACQEKARKAAALREAAEFDELQEERLEARKSAE
jgi:hypothetical protein